MTDARNGVRVLVGLTACLALAWFMADWLGQHVYTVPAGQRVDSAGFVVIVQSAEELGARARNTSFILFGAFSAILLSASLLAFASFRRSMRTWVRGLQSAIRGEGPATAYRPLLGELRELLLVSDGDPLSPAASSTWTRERLRALLRERLLDENVIVLANREPYIHERTPEGVQLLRPASGLVTALDPVMRSCSGSWIAHGSGSADRENSDSRGRVKVPPGEESYTLRRIWLSEEEERGFYYGFANEGLWPLCHLVHVRPSFRAADWTQYGLVNRRFANAVSEEAARPDPIVLIHDYHFALAPRFVRGILPHATIIGFWHIPWPNAERFGISPWREELLEGLLGADILGFHTQAHCNNFMDSVDAYLESRVDRNDGTVTRRGHTTLVRPYPISIEWPPRSAESAPPVAECRRTVFAELGLGPDTVLALGVDRMDYTKGFVERILAVEALLERAPDLAGRFVLVQLAAPSRTFITRYRELDAEVREAMNRVNSRFGRDGYSPVILLKGHHTVGRIMRFYRAADICYVSSLHDGMNLVAKEFAAAREDERGVLVLSQFAGASREFTEALIVNPYDMERVAAALETAARMHPDEQRARMHAMRSQLAEFNVYRWAGRMLSDAASLRKRVREPLHNPIMRRPARRPRAGV
jgi:trehalose 6-phosphate synthase